MNVKPGIPVFLGHWLQLAFLMKSKPPPGKSGE